MMRMSEHFDGDIIEYRAVLGYGVIHLLVYLNIPAYFDTSRPGCIIPLGAPRVGRGNSAPVFCSIEHAFDYILAYGEAANTTRLSPRIVH